MPYRKRKYTARKSATRKSAAARKPAYARRAYRKAGKRYARKYPRTMHLGAIMPSKVMTEFKAHDTWVPTAAAGGNYTQFYANNPYDPVVGASTTACSGFDKMMQIYTYGICYACKVIVRFLNGGAVNQTGYIYFTDSEVALPATQPSFDQINEIRRDIKKADVIVNAYNKSPPVISYYRTMRSLEGSKDLRVIDYLFNDSTGPSKALGVQVGSRPLVSTDATACSLLTEVTIIYYCTLHDLRAANIEQ